jgi:hypothetical protein
VTYQVFAALLPREVFIRGILLAFCLRVNIYSLDSVYDEPRDGWEFVKPHIAHNLGPRTSIRNADIVEKLIWTGSSNPR